MKTAKIIAWIAGLGTAYFAWVYIKPYLQKSTRQYPVTLN